MSALVELKALVDALEAEVNDLEKRRVELSTSFVKLEARKKYLTDAVSTLEKDYVDGKAAADANLANLKVDQDKEIKLINLKVSEAQSKLADIRQQIATLESEFATKSAEYTKKLETLQLEAETKDSELIALTTSISDYEAHVERLMASKSALSNDIAGLEASLEATRKRVETDKLQLENDIATVTERRKGIVRELDEKYDELEDLKNKLVAANKTVTEVEKREATFNEYEKRAIKALEAREEAILNKESELAITTRRRGILDNL